MAKNHTQSKPVSTTTVHKSAITGKFVSESYAKKHPKSTFVETVHKGGKKK